MRIITNSAVALGAALLLGLAGVSPSFAKAHDNGRTNPNTFGTAGQTSNFAGQVDDTINKGGFLQGGRNDNYGGLVSGGGFAGGLSIDAARDGGKSRSDNAPPADTSPRSGEGQASGNGGGGGRGGRN